MMYIIPSLRDFVRRNSNKPIHSLELEQVFGDILDKPLNTLVNSISGRIGKIRNDELFDLIQKWKYGFMDIANGVYPYTAVNY